MTIYNNSKGNVEIERVFRTLKEEIIWTREYERMIELEKAIDQWMGYYNTQNLYSSLGYKPPVQIEEEFRGKAA